MSIVQKKKGVLYYSNWE